METNIMIDDDKKSQILVLTKTKILQIFPIYLRKKAMKIIL